MRKFPFAIGAVLMWFFLLCFGAKSNILFIKPAISKSYSNFIAKILRNLDAFDKIVFSGEASQLVNNCKTAFDDDLFLDDRFLYKANINKFVGDANLIVAEDSNRERSIIVNNISKPVKDNGVQLNVAGVTQLYNLKESKREKVIAGSFGAVVVYNIELSIDTFEAVFGPAAEALDLPRAKSIKAARPILPKTHRFGNMTLKYSFDTSSLKKTITVLTNGDGTVRDFTCLEERK